NLLTFRHQESRTLDLCWAGEDLHSSECKPAISCFLRDPAADEGGASRSEGLVYLMAKDRKDRAQGHRSHFRKPGVEDIAPFPPEDRASANSVSRDWRDLQDFQVRPYKPADLHDDLHEVAGPNSSSSAANSLRDAIHKDLFWIIEKLPSDELR